MRGGVDDGLPFFLAFPHLLSDLGWHPFVWFRRRRQFLLQDRHEENKTFSLSSRNHRYQYSRHFSPHFISSLASSSKVTAASGTKSIGDLRVPKAIYELKVKRISDLPPHLTKFEFAFDARCHSYLVHSSLNTPTHFCHCNLAIYDRLAAADYIASPSMSCLQSLQNSRT